jgi:hypothetical protein
MKFASSSKFTCQKNPILGCFFPEALPQAEVISGLQPEEFVFLIFPAKGINQIKQNKVLFVQCLCGMN